MNSRIGPGVKRFMMHYRMRAAAPFAWHFYYGFTAQGRAYR